jgi:hypothetical protein
LVAALTKAELFPELETELVAALTALDKELRIVEEERYIEGLLVGQMLYLVKIQLGDINCCTRLKGYYNNLRVVYWPAPL